MPLAYVAAFGFVGVYLLVSAARAASPTLSVLFVGFGLIFVALAIGLALRWAWAGILASLNLALALSLSVGFKLLVSDEPPPALQVIGWLCAAWAVYELWTMDFGPPEDEGEEWDEERDGPLTNDEG